VERAEERKRRKKKDTVEVGKVRTLLPHCGKKGSVGVK
jgi:hypothetical protein